MNTVVHRTEKMFTSGKLPGTEEFLDSQEHDFAQHPGTSCSPVTIYIGT